MCFLMRPFFSNRPIEKQKYVAEPSHLLLNFVDKHKEHILMRFSDQSFKEMY